MLRSNKSVSWPDCAASGMALRSLAAGVAAFAALHLAADSYAAFAGASNTAPVVSPRAGRAGESGLQAPAAAGGEHAARVGPASLLAAGAALGLAVALLAVPQPASAASSIIEGQGKRGTWKQVTYEVESYSLSSKLNSRGNDYAAKPQEVISADEIKKSLSEKGEAPKTAAKPAAPAAA